MLITNDYDQNSNFVPHLFMHGGTDGLASIYGTYRASLVDKIKPYVDQPNSNIGPLR